MLITSVVVAVELFVLVVLLVDVIIALVFLERSDGEFVLYLLFGFFYC